MSFAQIPCTEKQLLYTSPEAGEEAEHLAEVGVASTDNPIKHPRQKCP